MHGPIDDSPPHRLRLRFSLFALLLFVTLACVFLAWWVQPTYYQVAALFQVSSSPDPSPWRSEPSAAGREFEIFQQTQLELIKSDFVLDAALRGPTVASLPVIKAQDDPVGWLREQVELKFLQNSEILLIRMRCPASAINDYRMIVDAVSNAYIDEVLSAEEQRRMVYRDSLVRRSSQLREQLRNKMAAFEKNQAADKDDPSRTLVQAEIDVLTQTWRGMLQAVVQADAGQNSPPRVRQLQPATAAPE